MLKTHLGMSFTIIKSALQGYSYLRNGETLGKKEQILREASRPLYLVA